MVDFDDRFPPKEQFLIAGSREERDMNHMNVVREVSRVAPLPWRVAAAGKGRRNPLAFRAVPACAAFFWGVFSLAAFGQPAATFVGGIIRDSSSGKPVPVVQVTAHNLN